MKREKPSRVTFTTFDGLVIALTLVPGTTTTEMYAFIEASVDQAVAAAAPAPKDGTAKPDPAADAAALNARAAGWAYRLPAYVVSNLMPARDTLVKDKAAAPKPDAAPGATPPAGPDTDEGDTPDAPPEPGPPPGAPQ